MALWFLFFFLSSSFPQLKKQESEARVAETEANDRGVVEGRIAQLEARNPHPPRPTYAYPRLPATQGYPPTHLPTRAPG